MRTTALLHEAAAALANAGVENAEWDAERLVRHVLGWDRATLVARHDSAIAVEDERRIRALVEQRARRVPLQHLLGTQAFWKHDFLVSGDVLIPRPETELLVETVLERLTAVSRPVIVDVGTGTGCIALSLAAERPDAEVHATDLSPAALGVARENARRLALEGRVVFREGDLLEPVRALAGRIDCIVSNPPYVCEAERDTLAPEVRDHEPALALFGLEPPLTTYRRLARAAASLLGPRGFLLVEIGMGQHDAVAAVLDESGLAVAALLPDLRGVRRAVLAAPKACR